MSAAKDAAGALARLFAAGIERYQRAGGGAALFNTDCNFTPSCSEYARQAILAHGAWAGARLGWRRICRCIEPDLPEPRPDPVPPAR